MHQIEQTEVLRRGNKPAAATSSTGGSDSYRPTLFRVNLRPVPCFNPTVDAGMWSVLGPVLGAVLAGAGAYWLFRAKIRRSETDRVRGNLRTFIRDVSLANRWLKEEMGPAASRSPEAGGETHQQEAARRATALYKLWDEIKIELQSPEITMALDDVHMSIDAALKAVIEGNVAPDLTELKERRDRLEGVVRKRLGVRL